MNYGVCLGCGWDVEEDDDAHTALLAHCEACPAMVGPLDAVDFGRAIDGYATKLTTDLRGFSAGEGLEAWVPTEGDPLRSFADMLHELAPAKRRIKVGWERAGEIGIWEMGCRAADVGYVMKREDCWVLFGPGEVVQ